MAGEANVRCPECGAPDSACEARFHELLALEFEEAGYGAVHHLTVATYMVQHSSKLTREGWIYERDLLRGFILDHKSPDLIRKQIKDLVDSGKRKFKITSKDGSPKIARMEWTRTILDVRTENSTAYCADITAWATATLLECEGIRTL